MIGTANIRGFVLPAAILSGLAATTALAIWGWAAHGEAIFLAILEGGLLTCL